MATDAPDSLVVRVPPSSPTEDVLSGPLRRRMQPKPVSCTARHIMEDRRRPVEMDMVLLETEGVCDNSNTEVLGEIPIDMLSKRALRVATWSRSQHETHEGQPPRKRAVPVSPTGVPATRRTQMTVHLAAAIHTHLLWRCQLRLPSAGATLLRSFFFRITKMFFLKLHFPLLQSLPMHRLGGIDVSAWPAPQTEASQSCRSSLTSAGCP